jgi:hypothetical protein
MLLQKNRTATTLLNLFRKQTMIFHFSKKKKSLKI